MVRTGIDTQNGWSRLDCNGVTVYIPTKSLRFLRTTQTTERTTTATTTVTATDPAATGTTAPTTATGTAAGGTPTAATGSNTPTTQRKLRRNSNLFDKKRKIMYTHSAV